MTEATPAHTNLHTVLTMMDCPSLLAGAALGGKEYTCAHVVVVKLGAAASTDCKLSQLRVTPTCGPGSPASVELIRHKEHC